MSQQFPLKQIEDNFKRVMQYAPRLLGNIAVNFFLDSFKRQGWLGNSLEPWAKRRNNKGRNSGRSILIKSGRLRRSIRITNISGLTVTVGTDVPYAKFHNEGFKGVMNVSAHSRNKYAKEKMGSGRFNKNGKERLKTVQRIHSTHKVTAHTRKVNMPRRQFMGESQYLTAALQRKLQAELMKGLKNTSE